MRTNKKRFAKIVSSLAVVAVMGMTGITASAEDAVTTILEDGTIHVLYSTGGNDVTSREYFYTPDYHDFNIRYNFDDYLIRVTCDMDNVEAFVQEFNAEFGATYHLVNRWLTQQTDSELYTYRSIDTFFLNRLKYDEELKQKNEFIVLETGRNMHYNWATVEAAEPVAQDFMRLSSIKTVEILDYYQELRNGSFGGSTGFEVYADDTLTEEDFAWIADEMGMELENFAFAYQEIQKVYSISFKTLISGSDEEALNAKWNAKREFMIRCLEMPAVHGVNEIKIINAIVHPFTYVAVETLENPNYQSPAVSALESADMDGNGVIDITDASMILAQYAQSAVSDIPVLTAGGILKGDINGDGKVDINDAAAVLQMYANNAAGLA